MAGAGLKRDMGFLQQGRAARNEQAHMGHQILGESGLVQQSGIESRYPHHRGRARQKRDHLIGLEAGQENHRCPGQEANVGRYEQAMGVKDRQGMQQHILPRELPVIGQRLSIGQQIVLGQHGPF